MIINYKDGSEFALDFDEDSHSYRVDGIRIPSVTKIVDACFPKFLTDWALSIGEEEYRRVIDEALEIGNATHKFCESFIKQEYNELEGDLTPSCEAFLKWYAWSDAEFLDAERKIYCDKFKYAGTVDAVAKINGRVCVIDFKTSKKIYKPYHLQVAAYCQAVKRMDGLRKWPLGVILRLDKETGEFEQKVFEPKHHFGIFRKCMELRDWSSIRIKNEKEKLGVDNAITSET